MNVTISLQTKIDYRLTKEIIILAQFMSAINAIKKTEIGVNISYT